MTRRLLTLALAALLAACGEKTAPPQAPEPKVEGNLIVFPAQGLERGVIVSTPVSAQPPRPVRLNGRVAWNEDRTVRVFSPLAGRIEKIMVEMGAQVRRGDGLAVIASPELGQAQAEARRAETELALAEKNLVRVRELESHGVAPRKDLQSAEAEQARAEAEAARTRARLALYGRPGGGIDQTYLLTSPIAGTVVEKNINPGQEIRPDQMNGTSPALFVVTDPGALWVWLDVEQKDLASLRPGKQVVLRSPAYRDADFVAVIAAVADFLDPGTRTIRARATLNNADRRLKAEMFVTAEIVRDLPPQIQVPAKAVFFREGKHYVFTDEGGGRFTRRDVTIGDSDEGTTTILAGLEEGQRVVTEGTLMLQQVLQPRRLLK